MTRGAGRERLGRIPTILLVALVPLVALLAAVVTLHVTSAGSGTGTPAGAGTSGRPDAITIANFRFSPDPLVVKAGTPIAVTNADGTVHTVTAKDGSFDTGDLAAGAHGTITIGRAGTYDYFCNIHNYMTGRIEVR
jgi:plastocyanin